VKVLRLCTTKERTAYELKKNLRLKSISAAQAQRDKLVKSGMLISSGATSGRNEKPCRTTLLGLVHLYARKEPSSREIFRIAEKYISSLPHIFPNWRYLKNFEAPAFLRARGSQSRADSIVSKRFARACKDLLDAPPRSILFTFDPDEFRAIRSAWSKNPLRQVYLTVDQYIEKQLQNFLEPQALLLNEMLHSSWTRAASPRYRMASSHAFERQLLSFVIAGNRELRTFALKWLWRRRLEALQETRNTEAVEAEMLQRYEDASEAKEEALPTTDDILKLERHYIKHHGHALFFGGWNAKSGKHEYLNPDDVHICSKCKIQVQTG